MLSKRRSKEVLEVVFNKTTYTQITKTEPMSSISNKTLFSGLFVTKHQSQNEHRQQITRNSYKNSLKRNNSQHVPKMDPSRDSLFNQKLCLFWLRASWGCRWGPESQHCAKRCHNDAKTVPGTLKNQITVCFWRKGKAPAGVSTHNTGLVYTQKYKGVFSKKTESPCGSIHP